ncbi:DHA2 family efflux MFS transporter permease subunit [Prosthecobacter sp.]|uniref:DHA2 family efflux MFS transporter permease subunit n=1 Tax=Prosthecobacter sp. TaxID=1965333 RepID=UPI0037834FF6
MNAAPRAINPWLVALAVVVPTFMEVLDTTIANVALHHIAGGLSAAQSDSEWVITSYLAANALVLPLTGWITAHLGRRRYFMLSITVFTIASMLCGLSTNLNMLIACRVLQGLAGGGLQPCSQGILLDTFPKEKQGAAQTFFGIAAVIAPVLGPTLGGWITDQYSWRWIFYINLPVGILAWVLCSKWVWDPEYLVQEREELSRQPLRFDFPGLSLLTLVIVAWEILLSKGQEWDWFGDPFGRIQTLVVLFVVGLVSLIWWEGRTARPIVSFKPMHDRNFGAASLIVFCAFAVLYGSSTLLPGMLETLLGYDALHAGLVLSPAGFFTLLTVMVVGRLLGLGTDARWLIAFGLTLLACGSYWMSHLNLEIAPHQVIWPRVVLVIGLGFIFAPLNVAAYLYIPQKMRGAAVGLFALLRNEGGSFGTSLGQTLTQRREQFHALRLNEGLDPFNPALASFLDQSKAQMLKQTGDPAAATQMSLQALAGMRDTQALALAYFDCFLIFAVAGAVLAFFVLGMRRSVAEKGAHVGAE